MKHTVHLLGVLGIIFVQLAGCKSQAPDEISNLVQVQSFGDGYGSGYIIRSMYLASDHKKYLYVADQGNSCILQFSFDGEFVKKIGSPGKGPGEFTSILNVAASEDLISVVDYRNYRVTFMSPKGELVDLFDINHLHMGELAFSGERVVLGATVNRFQSSGYTQKDRFYTYDLEGNQNSFGSFIKQEEQERKIPAEMSAARYAIEDGRLHVTYVYFPVYQIYDLDTGVLLAEHNLAALTAVEEQEQNSQASVEELLTLDNDVVGVSAGIDVVDERVFIWRHTEEMVFFEEFRLSGTRLVHLKTHQFVKAKKGVKTVADMVFIPSRDSFFMLETAVEGGFRISEYKIMEQKEKSTESPA